MIDHFLLPPFSSALVSATNVIRPCSHPLRGAAPRRPSSAGVGLGPRRAVHGQKRPNIPNHLNQALAAPNNSQAAILDSFERLVRPLRQFRGDDHVYATALSYCNWHNRNLRCVWAVGILRLMIGYFQSVRSSPRFHIGLS